MKRYSFLFLLISILISFFACTEPTLIGADLLEEDQANLNFRNDLPIDAKTILGDPVPTFNRFQALQLNHFLLGELEDENFGTSTASIYTQLSKGTGSPDSDILVDSLILSIPYDSLGVYGDFSKPFEVEIFRLSEAMDIQSDYNSDQVFATEMMPIGSATVVPSFDSVQIINYSNGTANTTFEQPHLRIPLNLEFAELLATDSSIYISDTTFQNFLPGLYIKPAAASNGIIPLRFGGDISRLTLYYSAKVRGIKNEYRFPLLFGQARVNHFEHQYEGTAAATTLDLDNTDLIYLQSMAGLNMEVGFPDLSSLTNIVINRAELEFTVASDIDSIFPVVEQLVATSFDRVQNVRTGIVDVGNAIQGSNPLNTSIFGGIPIKEEVNGRTLTKYKINISAHFQGIVTGEEPNSIIITAGTDEFAFYLPMTPKAERANQIVLYGPNHPEFAPKLNLTFTSL